MALTPFFSQMLSTWARGSTVAVTVDMVSRGMEQLRRDLGHALPISARDGFIGFRGGEARFEFPAATGLGVGRDGIEMIEVSVEPVNTTALALVRRRGPLVESGTRAEFKDPVVLFSGRYRYALSYVGPDLTRHSTWSDRPELPLRVEIDILQDQLPLLPTFALPVPTDFTVACLLQPVPSCPAAAEVRKQVQSLERMRTTPP
jgi:hypothetical protein